MKPFLFLNEDYQTFCHCFLHVSSMLLLSVHLFLVMVFFVLLRVFVCFVSFLVSFLLRVRFLVRRNASMAGVSFVQIKRDCGGLGSRSRKQLWGVFFLSCLDVFIGSFWVLLDGFVVFLKCFGILTPAGWWLTLKVFTFLCSLGFYYFCLKNMKNQGSQQLSVFF